MNCEIILNLLPAYLDESCSDEIKTIIEDHLKECPKCRKIVEELKSIEMTSTPTIDEIKPFKKIILNHRIKLFILTITFVLIFLLFGTRLNSEIMKIRFYNYVNTHYSEYNLVMTDFTYEDPETQGFGINNGFYIAHFKSQDENMKDIEFNVFTEGFIFSVKDTYKNNVDKKKNTADRLISEYNNDVEKKLLRQKNFYVMEVSASIACTDEYFEKNVADKLNLNMGYEQNIDEIIPINLTLEINATESDISDIDSYVNSIIDELHHANYHPTSLSLIIETENDSYQLLNILCDEDIKKQNLTFE